MLTLNTGDYYSGEILEAAFRKNWDANIGGTQPFVAKLDTTNKLLMLYGTAKVAGTAGNGWANNRNPIVFIDDTEIVVELESPISDTGAVAARDIIFNFYLIPSFVETIPSGETNYLQLRLDVDEDGLLAVISKYVNSVATTFWDGSTKDGNSARDPAANKFWKFKLVFNGKPGTAGATVSIYAKVGVTRVAMEADSWIELYDTVGTQNSPFSISDLAFHIAYPCYQIYTQNDTYFGAATAAQSTELTVTYPDFQLKWSDTDTDYTGGVELFDGDPATGGQRVLSLDHEFSVTDDIYIQNGLIRLYIDELAQYGLRTLCYSTSWLDAFDRFYPYLVSSTQTLSFPHLLSITKITPEECKVKIRFLDSATVNQDYYLDAYLTLRRGEYVVELEIINVYPTQNVRFTYTDATKYRFGYAGNNYIGDDDLDVTGNNAILGDNYLVAFDDAGVAVIGFLLSNQKPAGGNVRFQASDGGVLVYEDALVADLTITKLWFGAVPFALKANLFKEAESATITAAVRLYLDGAGEDTDTENTGVWAATTNCAKDENDATDPQVGAKDVKITSSAGGAVVATCTPAAPLGKLTKFDNLKLWLWSAAGPEVATVTIRLVDADGDSCTKAQAITDTPTQYSIALPHSATDLQGWTQVGTYDFATFTSLTVEWTAVGANEDVYVDGLHEYIGTTTTRGRGETLSGGSAVVLDAINEDVHYHAVNVLTLLPIGRYLLIERVKSLDNVASAVRMAAFQGTHADYNNEEHIEIARTPGATFSYIATVFDLSSIDSGDTIDFYCIKRLVTEDTLIVDYFLIIPLGDGRDGAMDLAHSALRTSDNRRRVYRR